MSSVSAPVGEGDVLGGKFRIDRIIGAGGMGVVVAATHLQLERRVALKFLHAAALENAEIVQRFAREARAAARLQSEHVARVLDVGTLDSGAPFMVMEFLEGTDLDDIVKRSGPLRVDVAVDYLVQACEALAEAHTAGIVHRDLKPANLFVTRAKDGSALVKILDFGVSKVALADEGSMTQTTATMGSPLYMSPEHLASTRDVDHRTDIWALGIILYQLLTGDVPYRADTMPQLCVKILSEPPAPLRTRRPDLSPGLEAVVMRCLARDRSARYANVAELALALAPFGPPPTRALVDKIARMIPGAAVDARSLPSAAAAPPAPPPSPAYAAPLAVGSQPGATTSTAYPAGAAPQAAAPAPTAFAASASTLPVSSTWQAGQQAQPAGPSAHGQPTGMQFPAAGAPTAAAGRGRVLAIAGAGVVLLVIVIAVVAASGSGPSPTSSVSALPTTPSAPPTSSTSPPPSSSAVVPVAPLPTAPPATSSSSSCVTCRRFLEGACPNCAATDICVGTSRLALLAFTECSCRACGLECSDQQECGGTSQVVAPECLACNRSAALGVCEPQMKKCVDN